MVIASNYPHYDEPPSNYAVFARQSTCAIFCSSTYTVLMVVVVDVTTLTHLCRPVRSKFAIRETASLGIMGEPRVPPLNPSESIVLSEHYRL